jgi:hypothetical protein
MSGDSSDAPPDVLGSAEQLAQILHKDRNALDRDSLRRGDLFLSIFNDKNFGRNVPGLNSSKLDVIKQAIEDLAGRGKILGKSYVGVTFYENAMQPFVRSYGENPPGNIVFKVGIKNIAAFQNWRNGSADEISEDDINAAIYRLTFEWSTVL